MPKLLDQYPFEFYQEHFTAVLADDRKLYVPLADMCEALGIKTDAQRRRVEASEVLADALVEMEVERAYGDEAIQTRQMHCLQLERLPFWLGTLQPSRIKDKQKRAQIIRFQREFADVAWAAFRSVMLPHDMLAELDAHLPPSQQRYLQMMDDAADLRHDLDEHDQQIGKLQQRVNNLEARIVGTDFINSAQKKQYIDMVGLVANLLQRKKKGNAGTVHAEIKRQFQTPSYQLIPEQQFGQVKKYLAAWYRRLSGPGAALPTIFESPDQKRLF